MAFERNDPSRGGDADRLKGLDAALPRLKKQSKDYLRNFSFRVTAR